MPAQTRADDGRLAAGQRPAVSTLAPLSRVVGVDPPGGRGAVVHEAGAHQAAAGEVHHRRHKGQGRRRLDRRGQQAAAAAAHFAGPAPSQRRRPPAIRSPNPSCPAHSPQSTAQAEVGSTAGASAGRQRGRASATAAPGWPACPQRWSPAARNPGCGASRGNACPGSAAARPARLALARSQSSQHTCAAAGGARGGGPQGRPTGRGAAGSRRLPQRCRPPAPAWSRAAPSAPPCAPARATACPAAPQGCRPSWRPPPQTARLRQRWTRAAAAVGRYGGGGGRRHHAGCSLVPC